MGSVAERYGPHCFWAVCQHPCCWEAERRVTKGISPQEVKFSSREVSPINDELPTLTIVDVSQWTRGKETRPNPLLESISTDSLMCVASHQNHVGHSLSHLKEQKRKSEKTLQFPPMTCLNSTNQSKQQVKLNTAWIEPLASCPSVSRNLDMLLMCVPYPDQAIVAPTQNSEERTKSPHVAVKEIFCLPPSETLIKSNIRKKTLGVKKRVRFQLAYSPCMSPLMATVLPGRVSVLGHTGGSWQGERDAQPSPLSDDQVPNTTEQRPKSALFSNKPVVFHNIREKKQRRVPGDTQIMYKLDYKNGEEGIDWQSLRAQPYLWKKYNLSDNREKDKAAPLEGAVAPLSPQPSEHLRLSAIPQAVETYHQRNPVFKGTAGKTGRQQSVPVVSQNKSILKESSKSSSSQGGQNPLHYLFKRDEYEAPIQPDSIVTSTSEPLQPEEHPKDHSEFDQKSAEARMSAKVEEPQRFQVTQPALHGARSQKRLQWADLESAEPEPEVYCPVLTAPPASPEIQHRKSPCFDEQQE